MILTEVDFTLFGHTVCIASLLGKALVFLEKLRSLTLSMAD